MDVTKPYKLIGFGAMDVTKPYKFIGFGDKTTWPKIVVGRPPWIRLGAGIPGSTRVHRPR